MLLVHLNVRIRLERIGDFLPHGMACAALLPPVIEAKTFGHSDFNFHITRA